MQQHLHRRELRMMRTDKETTVEIHRRAFPLLLAAVLTAGCSRTAQPSDTEVGASNAPAPARTDEPQSGATDAPGRARPGPASNTAAPATTSVDVAGNRSKVKIDVSDGGANVDVQNQRGRGSVQVSPTATTVRGAEGRGSVQISPTGTTVRGADGSVITVPAAPPN